MSPRSQRLSALLPKPKGRVGETLARLEHARNTVADELEHTRQVQALMAGCLKRYFETIPKMQVRSDDDRHINLEIGL